MERQFIKIYDRPWLYLGKTESGIELLSIENIVSQLVAMDKVSCLKMVLDAIITGEHFNAKFSADKEPEPGFAPSDSMGEIDLVHFFRDKHFDVSNKEIQKVKFTYCYGRKLVHGEWQEDFGTGLVDNLSKVPCCTTPFLNSGFDPVLDVSNLNKKSLVFRLANGLSYVIAISSDGKIETGPYEPATPLERIFNEKATSDLVLVNDNAISTSKGSVVLKDNKYVTVKLTGFNLSESQLDAIYLAKQILVESTYG